MLRIGGGRIAAPAPPLFRGSLQPAPGGAGADPGSLWPRQRRLGHASVSLAMPASLWPRQRRFVPVLSAVFGVHVAKESVAWPKKPAETRPLRPVGQQRRR